MSNSESKREQLQHQRMPVVNWQFEGITIPSASDSHKYLPLPQVVECWEEFEEIQDKFLLSMETEYTRFPPVDIRSSTLHGLVAENESGVKYYYIFFMNAVLKLLGLNVSLEVGYPTSRRIEGKQKGILETREIIQLAGGFNYILGILYARMNQKPVELSQPFVVIEAKRVAHFRKDCDGDLPDLVVNDHFDVSKRQIFTYMSCTKTGYGILSSGDASFFFKREATGNGESVLKISKGILWDDLLIPMAAFCQTAFLDMYEYKEEPERLDSFTQNDEQNEEEESSPEDDEDDRTYRPLKKMKEGEFFHMNTWSKTSDKDKSSTSDIDVTSFSLSINKMPFASGSCGNIYLGKVKGCKVAVKITSCGTAIAKTLANEIIMYKKLKAYWGQCVPTLLSYGTLAEGRVMYLATEFVESLELGKEVVTSTVIEAAVAALQVIHSCSILHGGISKRNILVVDHGQGGVYFIDFGSSEFTSNKEELRREIALLRKLLESLMASGN